jgi:hypothetical protein
MATYSELEQRLNRVQAEEARIKNELSKKRRSEDLRSKILHGVAALALAERDPAFKAAVLAHLDAVTERAADRALLGLAPTP